jgi:hypothetical protein
MVSGMSTDEITDTKLRTKLIIHIPLVLGTLKHVWNVNWSFFP